MSAQATMQEERIKTVVIKIDKEGRPHIEDDFETVVLNKTKNEEIRWTSAEPFRIDFHGDSPFYEDQFNHVHTQSGLVRRGVLSSRERTYKYTIEINGKKLDPRVKVDP
ncbi:MAG: hypothetical protein ACREAC_17220 [Blastocatellia bacterium]